jgi:hypothetical protein
MIKLSNAIDRVIFNMTVRAMLDPNNEYFYIPRLTLEKVEVLCDNDDDKTEMFWLCFNYAYTQYLLKQRIEELEELEENLDIRTGISIVKQALTYPIKQICANAGVSGDVAINTIQTLSMNSGVFTYGYDAKNDEYTNLIESGVIDPAKAVRVALENAASVAGLFLTTECVIVDDIE